MPEQISFALIILRNLLATQDESASVKGHQVAGIIQAMD